MMPCRLLRLAAFKGCRLLRSRTRPHCLPSRPAFRLPASHFLVAPPVLQPIPAPARLPRPQVPTTRALCLVGTGDSVMRDMFYDGNVK